VVEGSLRVHVAKTEVALALERRSGRVRLGVERVEVLLGVAGHDGNASEGDANHADHVTEVVGVALRISVSLRPVKVADLGVKSGLGRDRDGCRVQVGRVEVGLEVDQVNLRSLSTFLCLVAVRWERVGLDANVGQTFPHRAGGAQLAVEAAIVILRNLRAGLAVPTAGRKWARRRERRGQRRSVLGRRRRRRTVVALGTAFSGLR